MDIVDCQVHLGPGGAAEMLAAMNALGIHSVLVDEFWMGTHGDPAYPVGNGATRTTSPTAELAAWMYPGRFAYVVRVDRRDPEMAAVIRMARDARHARALRILVGMTRAEAAAFAAGEYDALFAAAADAGLPIFVAIFGNTEALPRYLRKHPDVKVIIDHCGVPPSKAILPIVAQMEGLPDSLEYWTKVGEIPRQQALDKVLKLADYPNVAVKWAHASAVFETAPYPNEALRPYLRSMLNAFGAERVMWASDITALPTGETWAEVLFTVINNPDLSSSEREHLLGRTARTWLSWPRE
jgi:predicted TIM-barrel fold metal-dependent hydrolase